MKISILSSVPWMDGTQTHAEAYQEAVEQVRFADELGFDCAWFTEHHFGTHGINSSVLSFAAYAAAVTRHIRIGTAAVIAPLYHPIRLAEEIAQVDILSGGRLELGIGSGYRLDEFRGLGVDPAESRAMFAEALQILPMAWTGKPFGFKGKYHSVPEGITVRPTPLQKPHPPIWIPAISQKTIEWIAVNGYRLMAATTASSISDLCRTREVLDQALIAAGRNPAETEFYVHVLTHVADKTFAELERDVAPACLRFADAAATGGTIYQQIASGPQGPLSPRNFDFAKYYNEHALMGPAEDCANKINDWRRRVRFNHLTCMFSFGLPHKEVMENMQRFARQVMPALREHKSGDGRAND